MIFLQPSLDSSTKSSLLSFQKQKTFKMNEGISLSLFEFVRKNLPTT